MKTLFGNFKSYLVLGLILLLNAAHAQEPKADKPISEKGIFVSLNTRGSAMQGPGNDYFAYFVFYGESGFWINEKVLAGISFGAAFLSNNMGMQQNYVPFETNVFVKYFPFKKKGLSWLGAQAQIGMANSGMEFGDDKEDLFTNIALGPAVNLKLWKTNFALNAALMGNLKLGASTVNRPLFFGQPFGPTGYLGISYTFKKHSALK